ncbi:transmembrane amino acid transporter protein-domain-containing protein [Leptodontidium sp. 2 PMI_412]|nr:amino acid transporter-like protein [Leptodontidium sp. MPI-SDFR-AT-0119]KAH9224490.1 transmembrane amino acid transporter protein-domain-containing protein [Leptodontidium sp. 2 PMI_412]
MSTPAGLALEGNDPRDPTHPAFHNNQPVETQLLHGSHDPSVTFEEYMYYAAITRAEEKAANEQHVAAMGPKTIKSVLKNRFSKGHVATVSSPTDHGSTTEKNGIDGVLASPGNQNLGLVSEAEWKNASRAVRTAGWSSVFYLITTDILGPFSVPWAFAQMGYGPGVALYTVFGGFAMYSGFQLWKIFMYMDSDRYPMKSYADAFFRVYGRWARHGVNILQAIQLLFTVSILILSNGQSISQISKGNLCFIVCLIIFMAAGIVVGQIRTLQRFSWLANFAIWINLLILFIVMGVAANSAPNFVATEASFGSDFGPGPIHTYAGTPPNGKASGGTGFTASLNGLNQAVYSYGGAMLFISFLAEMRHPWDFWKGVLCADIFIYVVYMFFGIFVYSYQGQYAYNPVMQGLSPYNWQTACNIMNLVTGLIAAALYGNIGIKVAYVEVFQELLNAPPLTTTRGKLLWVALVPAYWVIAWVVCAAIPQFSYISGLVGAVCILQFTYTFPAILAFGFQIQKDAMTPEEHFDPATKTYHGIDRGMKRWVRGFMVKWHLNTFNFIYFLGALCTAALGIYSSCLGLISAFNGGSQATSFGCDSPSA